MRKTILVVLKRAMLVAVMLVLTAGCQSRVPESATGIPEKRTATPFPLRVESVTPVPTATALLRASRISGNYDQRLTLHVGDSFILDNLGDCLTPVSFDEGVLQLVSGAVEDFTAPKTFRAVQPGTTRITAFAAPPCPDAPAGCQAPDEETLVTVTVIDPGP